MASRDWRGQKVIGVRRQTAGANEVPCFESDQRQIARRAPVVVVISAEFVTVITV